MEPSLGNLKKEIHQYESKHPFGRCESSRVAYVRAYVGRRVSRLAGEEVGGLVSV